MEAVVQEALNQSLQQQLAKQAELKEANRRKAMELLRAMESRAKNYNDDVSYISIGTIKVRDI